MTSFDIITDQLDFPEGPIALSDGTFIVVEIAGKRLTKVFPNGTLETVVKLDGGPNGAALGPDRWCYVCNSGGFEYIVENGIKRPTGQSSQSGWIERVYLDTGRVERLYESTDTISIKSPNDIVFDKHGGFWFTDHGKRINNTTLDITSIYYAKSDGSKIKAEISGMITPNGIGLSPDETTLYVSETVTRRLWAFDLSEPGTINKKPWPSPNGGTLVAGLPGLNYLDSLVVDSKGHICVASLNNGGIWDISPDGEKMKHIPFPDFFTTNICFGGSNNKIAFITLSSMGKLVSMPWVRDGMQLNFSL